MKRRNALLLALAFVLVAVLSVMGTLAYLTSSKGAVNVMTLGNVHIEQIEEQRVDDDANQTVLEDFENNKPLYPAVFEGSSINWAPADEWVVANDQAWKVVEDNENVVDKFVTVKNTGKSDAYVRTLIAYEGNEEYGPNGPWIHVVTNGSNVTPALAVNFVGYITVDGVDYTLFEYVYPEALAAGETTIPSLKQVYMNKKADNDVVEHYGETYDILVLSQAVQTKGFDSAEAALNEGFADLSTAEGLALAAEWFEGVVADYKASLMWDGTADTSWYDDAKTEFVLKTSNELAGLAELVDAGTTFEGKTVTLSKDVNLYAEDENGEPICFDPIGSYRNDNIFKGTFDGQGYTISGLNQNTWALDNGYYYTDCGLGLFGAVENATIKNLNIDGASISGESALCGIVASVAGDGCVFENITITNSNVADYQYYAGGIVGWGEGNQVYRNITLDETVVVGAQWGEFNNRNGGIAGGVDSSGSYLIENCNIACRIDGYNDVTSAYEWYNYRNSGMIIGYTGLKATDEAVTTTAATNVTCVNVTVTFGEWANYHYCQFSNMNYPWVRAEEGTSNSAFSNPRYGHPKDANDNTVVDENHVHADSDQHMTLLEFDNLFGGPADARTCVYGISEHPGVTVVHNNH